ncbi:TolC family protein [Pseudomonas gingeri]|uniref:TolC family protein n=1 Tax=Pseudomonas gingeri TaxID=117681 RepID=A0A7Y7WEJ1_9PSED|nr:TolC family protein [Pseudomonas gingeri]NWB47917.1 TolC family protein [Pseudomonas gingeri]
MRRHALPLSSRTANLLPAETRFLFARTGVLVLSLFIGDASAATARQASSEAATTTLNQLFETALQSEPNYRAAQDTLTAAQARERQAFGALLPQISATGNNNSNRRSYYQRDSNGTTLRDGYGSDGYQFSITQQLWRPANISSLNQAEKAAEQTLFQLADSEQQLYIKLASAWFDLMEAHDAAEFSAAQRDALKAQWDIARRAQELGVQGQPQVDDARAKYEQASADTMGAELDISAKAAALEQWTGMHEDVVQPVLRDDAFIPDMLGTDLQTWLAQLDARSPALQAAQSALAAADLEIDKQRAGHQPTVDLVATYGNTAQDVGNFPGQPGYAIRQFTVGVQASLPIYSGGSQSAKVSEALAMRDKALDDQESTRRQAILNIKSAYYGWRAGNAKAVAARSAIAAARQAMSVATAGSGRGLKVEADVLSARQQLVGARRDMRKGRYQQLNAYIKLKGTLGALSLVDIRGLDELFVPQTTDTTLSSLTPEHVSR